MDEKEIWWVAGFFEGEAAFQGRKKGSLQIAVAQVQREPLERLQRYFGGSINLYKHKNPNANDFYRWVIGSDKAVDIMMMVFHLMSPRRQWQIESLLRKWSASYGKGGWQKGRTHCPKGHEYTPENTYCQPSRPNTRKCRTCAMEYSKTYVRKPAQALEI